MNFFEAQDNARRATRRLVIAYVVATLLIIGGVTALVAFAIYSHGQPADPVVLAFTAAATAVLILGASAFKSAKLRGGGGQVARDLGGTQVPPDVSDPLRRRLRNVVEEMAIASGLPVPEIYVLEQEAGINAFAAGFAPGDAAIAVTRGTLEILNRDELQGVVAHEFSHVLNGDMRLNIRMMGVLFGIMVLGLIGRLVTRGSFHGRVISSRRNRGSAPALLIGIGLIVLGAIGVFFARLVKAAVSRQREYLADASAVQFTRQTDGIANALKKIAGYRQQSWFSAADPEEVSHMLFAHGSRLSSLFATHPPLTERIQALQPGFRPENLAEVRLPATSEPLSPDEPRVAGFAAAAGAAPAAIADMVGNPDTGHLRYAIALRQSLPEELHAAAHSPANAWLLALALFVNRRPERRDNAYELLQQQLGAARCGLVRSYCDELGDEHDARRMPLLEMAFPALRQTPPAQLQYLLDLGRRLIELDGVIDLGEFCLYRVLEQGLARTGGARQRASKKSVREAALALLGVVAYHGHRDDAARAAAFAAGLDAFGGWAKDAQYAATGNTVERLHESLDVLERMNNAARKSLVQAMANTVAADGRLRPAEAEMLRAVCATLDCPLPPLTGIDPRTGP